MIKIIAETAWHHEGDIDYILQLIDQLIKQDIEYIKVHVTIDLDEYIDTTHPAYEILKKWCFSEGDWRRIINKIGEGGKKPFFLVNDQKSIDLAKEYNPELIEVHSVCLNDIHLLKKIKTSFNKNTKIVLGVGGSTLYEIENAISFLNTDKIVLMHGFQNYPTKYEDINFKKIHKLIKLYPQYEHGYADHCGWNEPNNILITTIGASLNMKYIEKHVTTNWGKNRCDWNSAISIEMLNELINNLKVVDLCNGNGQLSFNQGEENYAQTGIMKKAAFLAHDVKKGDTLKETDLFFKRTGQVCSFTQYEAVKKIGCKFLKDGKMNEPLSPNQLKS